ncbi:MAG: PEFG-CTERM sorting domain-containing protein [Nitrosopumilus sp.]|nr:PEFG-CTERM sorting domain-containing protein [Nitrosopumilus sp.]
MNFKRSTTTMVIAIMALSLISMTSVQQDVFASGPGMSITATADQGSNTIAVTGMTALGSATVTFQVVSPSGNNLVTIDQVIPNEDGSFTTTLKVGPTWNEDGLYSITAQQSESSIYTLTVFVEVTSGMTGATDVTESTLETKGIIAIQTDVARDAGIEISAEAVEGSDTIIITGSTDRPGDIVFTVKAPNGNLADASQVSPDDNGEFVTEFKVNSPMWKQNGLYTVTAQQYPSSAYISTVQVDIQDGLVVPEFGTIAAMILAVAIISIIAISAKSRLSIIPRY